jgi:hypothetical protein
MLKVRLQGADVMVGVTDLALSLAAAPPLPRRSVIPAVSSSLS